MESLKLGAGGNNGRSLSPFSPMSSLSIKSKKSESEEFGDEELVEFVMDEYRSLYDIEKSGTHMIDVDGVGHWVKYIRINDREVYTTAKREMDINIELTESLPQYISKLAAAKLMYNEDDDEDEGFLYLVFEPLNGMDLLNYINHWLKKPIVTSVARAIYCSAQKAINELHELGYAHRDIKPENIFVELNADGSFKMCKLIDFGTLVPLDEMDDASGTEPYLQKDRPLRVTTGRNQYSLNMIWSLALGQESSPPLSCVAGPAAEGGRRRRRHNKKTMKRSKKRKSTMKRRSTR